MSQNLPQPEQPQPQPQQLQQQQQKNIHHDNLVTCTTGTTANGDINDIIYNDGHDNNHNNDTTLARLLPRSDTPLPSYFFIASVGIVSSSSSHQDQLGCCRSETKVLSNPLTNLRWGTYTTFKTMCSSMACRSTSSRVNDGSRTVHTSWDGLTFSVVFTWSAPLT